MPEVILPALPPLTPDAKQELLLIADIHAKGHRERILHYLETGELKIEELSLLGRVPDIKEWLIQEYNARCHSLDPQPEAVAIDQEYVEWESIKSNRRLEDVFKYLNSHPSGVFCEEARALLNELKGERLKEIKARLGYYTLYDFIEWTKAGGIFTQSDFIEAGIVTKESLDALKVPEMERDLSFAKTNFDCPTGCTDVYFLGIPGTGKTCILMGLLSTGGHLEWDHVRFGGDYGCALQKLCVKGVTPMYTPRDFATLITGNIPDYEHKGIKHPVNLIEMSGMAFMDIIVRTNDAMVSIRDMGDGIPQMLSNPNDKIFFIVIDPTSDVAKWRAKIEVDGKKELVEITVPLKATLTKFCDLLAAPENREIMRKVKGIYFVVTKADCLGAPEEREAKSVDIVMNRYGQSVEKLRKLCHPDMYDLNALTGHELRVFPFSLGTFYLGGTFKCDPSDSDALLKVIAQLSAGPERFKTLWKRIGKFFSN